MHFVEGKRFLEGDVYKMTCCKTKHCKEKGKPFGIRAIFISIDNVHFLKCF